SFNATRMGGKSAPYPKLFPEGDDWQLVSNSMGLPPAVLTDKDGRFQIGSLGNNRLAILSIEGPDIAKAYVHVVTRDMEPLAAQPSDIYGIPSGTYFGRKLQIVVEPSQDIVGKLTDAETGQPLAGIEVCVSPANSLYFQSEFLTARTDAQGRY